MSVNGFKVNGQVHKYKYSELEDAPSIDSAFAGNTYSESASGNLADSGVTSAALAALEDKSLTGSDIPWVISSTASDLIGTSIHDIKPDMIYWFQDVASSSLADLPEDTVTGTVWCVSAWPSARNRKWGKTIIITNRHTIWMKSSVRTISSSAVKWGPWHKAVLDSDIMTLDLPRIFRKVVLIGMSRESGHVQMENDRKDRFNPEFSVSHYLHLMTGQQYINCAESGSTTASWPTDPHGLALAQSVGEAQAYIIHFMENDISAGISVANFTTNLTSIINSCKQISSSAKIFLDIEHYPSEDSGSYVPYINAVKSVASSTGSYVIDMTDNDYSAFYNIPSITNDEVNEHQSPQGYVQRTRGLLIRWSRTLSDLILSGNMGMQDIYRIPFSHTYEPLEANSLPVKDISGYAISFEDGADCAQMKSIIIEIPYTSSGVTTVPIIANNRTYTYSLVNSGSDMPDEVKAIGIYGGTIDLTNGLVESKYASDGTELVNHVTYHIDKGWIYTKFGHNDISCSVGTLNLKYYADPTLFESASKLFGIETIKLNTPDFFSAGYYNSTGGTAGTTLTTRIKSSFIRIPESDKIIITAAEGFEISIRIFKTASLGFSLYYASSTWDTSMTISDMPTHGVLALNYRKINSDSIYANDINDLTAPTITIYHKNKPAETTSKIKILLIGNSKSKNSSDLLNMMLGQLGFSNAEVLLPYKGGITLQDHWDNRNDASFYDNVYTGVNYTPGLVSHPSDSLVNVIAANPDITHVIFQQGSLHAANPESYNIIGDMVQMFENCNTIPLFYIMSVWGNDNGTYTTEEALKIVKDYVSTKNRIIDIIPIGSAVDKIRYSQLYKNKFGSALSDGVHLSAGTPKMLASLMIVKTLFGLPYNLTLPVYGSSSTNTHLLQSLCFQIARETNAYEVSNSKDDVLLSILDDEKVDINVELINGSASSGVITLGGNRWVNDKYLPVDEFTILENRTSNNAFILHYNLVNGEYVWTKSVTVAANSSGSPVPAYGDFIRLFFYSTSTTTNDFSLIKIPNTINDCLSNKNLLKNIFKYPVYTGENNTFILGRMNETNGGIAANATDGAHNNLFYIYAPMLIRVPSGYLVSVNQYRSITDYSTARFIKCLVNVSGETEIFVESDSYPAAIMVGIKKGAGETITTTDLNNVNTNIQYFTYEAPPVFASLSMFPNWAMTGCSWDAGSIYNTSAGHVTHAGLGWAENIARQTGTTVHNYAIGGTSIRTWFNYENSTQDAHSFKALINDTSQPLYILIFGGVNDRDSEIGFVVNDSSYSSTTPSTTTYYIGSLADINTRNDYHTYPCTFYGYYGRVIEMIQEHAPNCRIVISSPNTKMIGNNICEALETACEEIADYYNLPFMDIKKDPYYQIYVSKLISDHPTAPTYSGWGMAIDRLFGKCVEDYYEYFRKWSGTQTTVSVTWSKVEL